jgi:Fur family transcriptional regulator, ferric uptake regulator
MRSNDTKLAAILSQNGYKLTVQRLAVLDVIANSQEHLTPAAIHEKVRQDHPQIGLVTVYRTLQKLSELGLICKVQGEGKSCSYTLSPAGHHHHLVCSECGAVADFTGCDLEGLVQKLTKETGFKIEGHLLQFSGICGNCQG